MKHILFVILLITCSYRVFTQDTVRVQQNELVELQSAIIRHSHKDTIRVHMLTDYANLCFYNLDFLKGFKALSEARIISKQLKFTKGEGLYLKSISIFRRRINAGNAYIKTQDISKMNEVSEFINGLDIYYEVEGNRILGRYTDFEVFGNIIMLIGIRDSEIETIISKLEEALSYYSEKENVEFTAYLQDALSFILFNSDKEKSKKHKKVAQGLYQELKWSYHQLFILARDIDNLLELGKEAEAKPLEIEAINIYTNEADKYIKAHCAYLLSRTYGIHNRVNLQLEYLFQAEELLTEIGEKDLLKPVYISVAIVYEWLMTNSEKALEYEYKELNLRKEINYNERVAYTYLLISESLLGLKRIQDFPPEYKDYLKIGGIKGSLFFDAELLWVKARMLQAQGKSEEAQSVFQESISAYQKANDPIGGIWPSMDLAESFRGDGDIKNAIKHALIAYEWASKDKLGFLQFRAADILSQLYEQSGEKSKAFDYLKKYRAIKDETEKLNSAARISELEVQSILNKRQREIELLESESQLKEQKNKTQRIWLISIAGALVSLVFLSFILVRNNRQKQKANQVLNSKNKELEIEAALERVRSASMAMHKSEELVDVATVLYKELRNLDVREFSDANIVIFDESKNQQIIWGARTEADYLEMAVFPLLGDEILQKLYDLWSRKETFFTVKVEGSALKKHCEFVFPIASRTELEAKVIEDMPDPTFFHCAYFSMGYLELVADKELGEGSSIILTRFAKVFDQSYTRFLDLQKAEAQAKEAQIEASLERVRAATMAMHRSEELAVVVSVLYQQFNQLEITDWGCNIMIFNEHKETIDIWFSGSYEDKISTPLVFPDRKNVQVRKMWEAWKTKTPRTHIPLKGKEKEEYDTWSFSTVFKDVPEQIKKAILSMPEGHFNLVYMKYGLITAFDPNSSLSDANYEVVERFAKVFEQSYTRFLDLQKAEAQAREAQIEAGLERVRSRSMAMHKSEELSELVTLVYEEIKPFGFATAGVELILIDEKNKLQQYWVSTAPENKIIECFNIPTSIHPHFQKQWKAWEDQIPRLTLTLEGQEKKAFDQLIFTKTDFKNLSDDVKEFILNHGNVDVFSHAIMKYGLLEAVDKSPLSEEKFVILERFAKVFEQTYTRFLDLQKSEAQAREARIEAALEKIRSRSLGMHHSIEIKDVVAILFEKLKELDLVFDGGAAIHLFPEGSGNAVIWVASPLTEPICVNLPYDENAFENNPIIMDVWKAKENGEHIYNKFYSFEEKNRYFDYVFRHNDFVTLPKPAREFILQADSYTASFIAEKNSLLGANSWTRQLFSGNDFEVLKRIARVFEQAYIRFLDLQKAEAQAREAQIEAALERVRSRTMAMRRSGELADVATILFQQVKALGVPQWVCGFCIFEIDDKEFTWYPGSPDGDILTPCKVPLMEHPVFIQMNESRKRGDELYVYEIAGEIQAGNYRYMLTIPGLRELLQNMLDAGLSFPEFQINHLANFSHGNLLFITYEHFPEMHDIFKRFTKVFEQTYTRFLDLQKAEAQAREAIKRASVDRVRAEIASMRTTSDLERIQPLIWNELKTLGVPFIRCGVFIMDEEKQEVQTMLSTPEGKAIATLHVPFEFGLTIITNGVLYWRKKKVYTEHWDAAAFTKVWIKLSSLRESSMDSPQTEHPPESLHLHMLPFLQGMLYVGSEAPLNDEQLHLVQNLADAFATAYARYEDFNKLEAAKKQVDNTLNELQATQKQLIQSEKMASLGELTAGIAHEIQNPLNFVNNFSEVNNELIEELKSQKSKLKSEEQDEILNDIFQNNEKINHHGKRADAIVKGMLQHSSSGSGKKEPTDINALADEYLRLAYHGLRAKDKSFNATMKTDFDESIGNINIIPQDIGRVVLNLINNAFYAASLPSKGGFSDSDKNDNPTVWVSTRKVGDKILISVRDNGPGIPQKILDKIFQPFFTTKPSGQGTGLGLSLAYDIVKAHGGTIEVKTNYSSQSGTPGGEQMVGSLTEKGSEFLIKLPISP